MDLSLCTAAIYMINTVRLIDLLIFRATAEQGNGHKRAFKHQPQQLWCAALHPRSIAQPVNGALNMEATFNKVDDAVDHTRLGRHSVSHDPLSFPFPDIADSAHEELNGIKSLWRGRKSR